MSDEQQKKRLDADMRSAVVAVTKGPKEFISMAARYERR
jgi:hypothetical protein